MPRREPRWARERRATSEAAPPRPEPRFGVTDYVPAPRTTGAAGAGAARAATEGAGEAATSGNGGRTPDDRAPSGGGPRRRRRWRLPLAMLLLGLLLGAGGVGALVADGTIGTTTAAPAPTPTRSSVKVTVPESCTEAGRLSEQVAGITQEIVTATGELDAARLQVLVDQLQQIDPQVREATQACRQDSPTLSATTG